MRRDNQLVNAFVVACALLLVAVPAHAQIVPCDGLNCELTDLFQLLINIYNFLLGLAGLVAMLFLIWGGLQMLIYHYFEDAPNRLNSAKLTVTRAITGLAIVALAYVIVNTLLTVLGYSGGNTLIDMYLNIGN